MNTSFSRKFASVIASVALIGGAVAMTAGPAAADVDTELEITEGVLSANLEDNVTFDSVAFSFFDQQSTGAGTLLVSDATGEFNGWTASIQATNLVNGGENIPAQEISLTTIGDVEAVSGTGSFAPDINKGATGALDMPRVVLSAADGDGAGQVTSDLDFEVNIDANKPAGNYVGEFLVTTGPAV